MANGRCKVHGGTSRKGENHPNYKDGTYSKYALKGKLATYYEQGIEDKERLSLEAERLLLLSRLQQLLDRVDTKESANRWHEGYTYWKDLKLAHKIGDAEQALVASNNMDELYRRVLTDYAAWGDILKVLNAYKAVVESERKREIELGQMVALDKNMELMQHIAELVIQNVADRKAINAIAEGLVRIFGLPTISGVSSRVIESRGE